MSDPLAFGATPTTTGIRTSAGIHLGFASRGSRLFGQMIDSCIASAPVVVMIATADSLGPFDALLGWIATVWMLFYLVFGDGLHGGQSFSKQLLGMRVVDANTGAPCTFGQSFLRNVTLLPLGLIDCIFIFGDRHQRLGDKIAGTIVVMAD